MKKFFALIVTVCALAPFAFAAPVQDDPPPALPSFGVQYTLSGDNYATLTYPVQESLWGMKGLTADLAGGVRFRDSVPVFGFGIGYSFDLDKATAKISTLILWEQGQGVPATGRADIALGLSIGVRF